MQELPEVVTRYIEGARPGHRRALHELARAIRSAAPQAAASTRRQVPAFHHRSRPLVSLGDARDHVSLYIMFGKVLSTFAHRLAGRAWSTTVVRFDPDKPIPHDLVVDLVRARVAEIEQAAGRNSSARRTRPAAR